MLSAGLSKGCRIMRTVALAGLASLALSAFGSAYAQDADPEAGVRAAVMDYFEGGNAGDAERVANAFATEVGAMYVRRSGQDGDQLRAMNLGEFAARFQDPIPFEREGVIEEIRIVDDTMAFAHFNFTTPERQYDDFFLLYRIDGAWKIVSKAFTSEAVE